MLECPACHHRFDSRDVENAMRYGGVEQATAAPGEVRTVIRPPAVTPDVERPGRYRYDRPADDAHGPNAGDEDETGNG